MTRPTPTATTERLYSRLPELYRAADEEQAAGASGYPLLRYLSTIIDQAGDLEALADRVDRVRPEEGGTLGDTSDLVDPATADGAWLPWLAQLVAVDLVDVTDLATRRTLLANANGNRSAGSEAAIRARVSPLLTGTKKVTVAPHYGDLWTVGVITRAGESAGTTPALILVAATTQKPAGVVLAHDYGLTWTELEAGYPTWTAIEAAGSWDGLV